MLFTENYINYESLRKLRSKVFFIELLALILLYLFVRIKEKKYNMNHNLI